MTPMFRTGSRKYRIRYSILVNGEEYPKEIIIQSQNKEHANATLLSRFSDDTECVIHETTRI